MQFESLSRKNIVYVYKNDHEYHANKNHLWDKLYEFDSYGDGTTQHSPLCLVVSYNGLDSIASWAKYLVEHRETWNDLDLYDFRPLTNISTVKFFQSLRYNEKKPVYYNANDLKKSSAGSKQYDKRWEKIPDWADGSIDAIYFFQSKAFYTYLDQFRLIDQIREHVYNMTGAYHSIDTEKYFNLDTDAWRNLRDAVSIIERIYGVVRGEDSVTRGFSCLENNWINRIPTDETAA